MDSTILVHIEKKTISNIPSGSIFKSPKTTQGICNKIIHLTIQATARKHRSFRSETVTEQPNRLKGHAFYENACNLDNVFSSYSFGI